MPRPEFPNCVMTPNVIRGVVERQNAYDKDPEGYERGKREYREELQREEMERREEERKEIK